MMNGLTQQDLISPAEYERQRETFRRRIIELKRRRRIAIGDLVTLVFENRDTIQFQIQEMVRAERIVDPAKVQDELDVSVVELTRFSMRWKERAAWPDKCFLGIRLKKP